MRQHQLSKAKIIQKRLTREAFVGLENMTRKEITNLPPASCVHETEFGWENFESTVFFPFIHDFTSEIEKAFSNIKFWIQLSIFDPRKLPLNKDELKSYGTSKLEAILNHYGKVQSKTFHGYFVQQEPDIDPTRAKAEWDDFKILMFLKRKDYKHPINTETKAVKNPNSEEEKKKLSVFVRQEKCLYHCGKTAVEKLK